MNLLLQWPLLAFCSAYHSEIVLVIFGGRFIEDSWLLPLVVAFGTITAIDVPVTLVAQYEEKAGVILSSKIFAFYNVIALLLLLPRFGLYGAAVATGTAQIMKTVFVWWHVRRSARWENAGAAAIWGLGLWAAVILGCESLKAFTADLPMVTLVVGLIVVMLGLLVHLRGPAIGRQDRALLSVVLKGKEAAVLRRLGVLVRD
jgi:O-antigen/teichoic acid export membrane protein